MILPIILKSLDRNAVGSQLMKERSAGTPCIIGVLYVNYILGIFELKCLI